MNTALISEKDFNYIRSLLYKKTGIFLSDMKKNLIVHRLMKRLAELNMDSFTPYVEYLRIKESSEMQLLINHLTTNETFFFQRGKSFYLSRRNNEV